VSRPSSSPTVRFQLLRLSPRSIQNRWRLGFRHVPLSPIFCARAQGTVSAHTTRDPGQVFSSPRSRQAGKVGVLRIPPRERGESGRFLPSDYPGSWNLCPHPETTNRILPHAKQRDFQTNYASIPPHGRWRHIDAGLPRVAPLLDRWRSSPSPPSDKEITKRLIDLFLVSVLLDAGAGNVWSYTEASSGQNFRGVKALA
jgi:hypothetical protein